MAVDVINGSDLFVFMDDVVVGHATNHTLTFKMATRNTSNKDSGIYETKDVGRFDVSASCEGLFVYADNVPALFSAMKLRVPVTLEFGQKAAGVETLDTAVWYAHGDFIITSLEFGAPDQGNATYNVQFEHYSDFGFTPDASLNVRITGSDAVLHDGTTGTAAVFVTGGIEPYSYTWSGGTGPALNGKPVASGLNGTAEGVVHTCTVTDSTPVTPLTGTASITLYSPAS
jgi:hypothetical protein